MPKGLFGEKKKGTPSTAQERELKGQQFLVGRHQVVIDRKLAEGGFAIVYLCRCVRTGRKMALKRQFVNDPRQLEACKREMTIIRSLSDHANIITFVDASISQVDEGVYEYLLLTQYYNHSVLSLMNERLMSGQCLSLNEILNIFCDMCCAVARLHHSQTPVIHRDLKVENILTMNDRECVLCDFGSATTKILSTQNQAHSVVEEEVLKFTTLSYRAPEMIDLYAGKPITTKSDVWALGVMLYKLAYFTVPFGESALAIQNGTFSFPSTPEYPHSFKALIRYILEPDCERRPDIFQVASVAFYLADRRSPVPNLHNVSIPRMEDLMNVLNLHEQKTDQGRASESPPSQASSIGGAEPLSTTVAPRQRPKPSSSRLPPNAPAPLWKNINHTNPSPTLPPVHEPVRDEVFKEPLPPKVKTPVEHLGFQDLVEPQNLVTKFGDAETSFMTSAAPILVRSSPVDELQSTKFVGHHLGHRRNVSDTSALFGHTNRTSAFKPYVPCGSSEPDSLDMGGLRVVETASQTPRTHSASEVSNNLDNASFGEAFDLLPRPRRDSMSSTCNVKSSESLVMEVDETDPFGAAPFHPTHHLPKTTPTQDKAHESDRSSKVAVDESIATLQSLASSIKHNRYKKFVDADDEQERRDVVHLQPPSNEKQCNDSDSVGSASDLRMRMQASSDDSDTDVAKENITYTHLDANSSDSAGPAHRNQDNADSPSSEREGSISIDLNNPRFDAEGGGLGHEPLIDYDELEELGSSIPNSSTLQDLQSPSDTIKTVDTPTLNIQVEHVVNIGAGVESVSAVAAAQALRSPPKPAAVHSMDRFGAMPMTVTANAVTSSNRQFDADKSLPRLPPKPVFPPAKMHTSNENNIGGAIYCDESRLSESEGDDSSTELHFSDTKSSSSRNKQSKKKTFSTKNMRHEVDSHSKELMSTPLALSGSLGRKKKGKKPVSPLGGQEAAFVNTSFQGEDSESPPSPMRPQRRHHHKQSRNNNVMPLQQHATLEAGTM